MSTLRNIIHMQTFHLRMCQIDRCGACFALIGRRSYGCCADATSRRGFLLEFGASRPPQRIRVQPLANLLNLNIVDASHLL